MLVTFKLQEPLNILTDVVTGNNTSINVCGMPHKQTDIVRIDETRVTYVSLTNQVSTFVCVCVRACVRACVRVCVCVCVL